MNDYDFLNESRPTFPMRRAMVFGMGVAAVRSILPESAKASENTSENPHLFFDESESSPPPINDCTLVVNSVSGEPELIELDPDLDEEKLIFASAVRPLFYSYQQENFHSKQGKGSCFITGSISLGPNYSVYAGYGPNHAFDSMSQTCFPSIEIGGCETLGYALPDINADDTSEDVAEFLLVAQNDLLDESYVKPVVHKYGDGETFEELREKIVQEGRKLFLTGFPGRYYEDGSFNRVTFDVRLREITEYRDEDVKFAFEFIPTGRNEGVPANILPGCSGGAFGYVEDGVPHIIAIQKGYYNDERWLGVSINTSYATDFIEGESTGFVNAYRQPTTFGLNEPRVDIEDLSEILDMTDLTWYLLKNSNYPTDELKRMLWFQEDIRIYDYSVKEVKIWNKRPVLMVDDRSGQGRNFIWDREKKKFVDFNG